MPLMNKTILYNRVGKLYVKSQMVNVLGDTGRSLSDDYPTLVLVGKLPDIM